MNETSGAESAGTVKKNGNWRTAAPDRVRLARRWGMAGVLGPVVWVSGVGVVAEYARVVFSGELIVFHLVTLVPTLFLVGDLFTAKVSKGGARSMWVSFVGTVLIALGAWGFTAGLAVFKPSMWNMYGFMFREWRWSAVWCLVMHWQMWRAYEWWRQVDDARGCPECGYDLRATADGKGAVMGRCPECGWGAERG